MGNDTFPGGGILVFVLNMWVGEVGNDTFAGGVIIVLVLVMLVGEVESNTVTLYSVQCTECSVQCKLTRRREM